MSDVFQRWVLAVILFGILILAVRLQSKGVKLSIDFGNALVGVGGLALAWATLQSTKSANATAQRNLDKTSNLKIAEFRMKWISDLRDAVAQYIRLHRSIELIRFNSKSGKVPIANRDDLLDLLAVRVRIQTMLKSNNKFDDSEEDEGSEDQLLHLMSQDVPSDAEKAKKDRQKIVELARAIEKSEWAVVKSEARS